MNNRFRFAAPSVADEEELDDQLVAYNLRKVPCRQGEPFVKFCRCAYNEKNELVGGVLACSILWNILSIESVWVAENYRTVKRSRRRSESSRLLYGTAGYV